MTPTVTFLVGAGILLVPCAIIAFVVAMVASACGEEGGRIAAHATTTFVVMALACIACFLLAAAITALGAAG